MVTPSGKLVKVIVKAIAGSVAAGQVSSPVPNPGVPHTETPRRIETVLEFGVSVHGRELGLMVPLAPEPANEIIEANAFVPQETPNRPSRAIVSFMFNMLGFGTRLIIPELVCYSTTLVIVPNRFCTSTKLLLRYLLTPRGT